MVTCLPYSGRSKWQATCAAGTQRVVFCLGATRQQLNISATFPVNMSMASLSDDLPSAASQHR